MTSVNVSETHNTIVVTEQTGTTATVIVPSESVIVNAIGIGPQGPAGPAGPAGIVVDETNRVNKSIVYFDAGTATYKADAIITDATLTDGGNF